MDIGDRIRARRKALGLSQQQCADEVGCSKQAWSRWERGDTPVPTRLMPQIGKVLQTVFYVGMAPEGFPDPSDLSVAHRFALSTTLEQLPKLTEREAITLRGMILSLTSGR